MGKYLVLYRASVTTAQQMNVTPEQAQAGMDLWTKWAGKAGDVEGGPAIGLDEIDDLARQGAAGDQEHMPLPVQEVEFLGRFDIDEGDIS